MSRASIDPTRVPLAVVELLPALHHAGGRAWLVGGTVRDLLRDRAPRDWDVATDLPPDAVQRAIPRAGGHGARFGVCTVASPVGDISISSLRREHGYADHRRPDHVEFVRDVAIDARRRDFTVNALYADAATGAVTDPAGGLDDLAGERLRAIGDPAVRFAEDPLRLLRAARLAARCGLSIEPQTAAAARSAAERARTLSAERVFGELTDAFCGEGRGRALQLLVDLGLAAVLLPEVAAMEGVTQPAEYHPEGDVLTHVCLVLDHVPAGDPVLAWSAVLHDVGKPPTWRQAADRIRFDGHDVVSADMADAVLRRLHANNTLREVVVDVCRQHIRFAGLPQMRPKKAERWLRSPVFPAHLAFHRADCLASHGKLDVFAFAAQALAALPPLADSLVSGADVIALGVAPGPDVGRLLRDVHAAADEAPTPMDRQQALVLLQELVARQRQGPGRAAR